MGFQTFALFVAKFNHQGGHAAVCPVLPIVVYTCTYDLSAPFYVRSLGLLHKVAINPFKQNEDTGTF